MPPWKTPNWVCPLFVLFIMLLPGVAGFVFSFVEALIFGAEPGLSCTPVYGCFLTEDEMVLRFFIAISPVLELRLGEAPRIMGPPARP